MQEVGSAAAEEDLGVLGEGNPGKSQTVATRDDPKKRLVSRRQKADESFMSTVMEIEKAIEELPSRDMQKLFSWVEEKQAMMESTASLFAIYDEEEGEGTQWHE